MIWLESLFYDVMKSDTYDLMPESEVDYIEDLPVVLYTFLSPMPINGPYQNAVASDVAVKVLADTREGSIMVAEDFLNRLDSAHTAVSQYGWISSAEPVVLPWRPTATTPGEGVHDMQMTCRIVARHD